jgi:hypothetical protein
MKKPARPLAGALFLLQSWASLWYHSAADLAMQIGRATPGDTRKFPEIGPGFFVYQNPVR